MKWVKLLHIRSWGVDKRDIIIAFVTIWAMALFIPIFTYAYFARDLGSKELIMNLKDTGVILLDDQGKPFFSFYQAKYKSYISLNQVPKITQQAVISSEDKNFYSHPGFSPPAIIRSALVDVKQSQLAYGGSTITQQLVKNSLLTPNKSLVRKYQEIVLAAEIERRYSKDEILEMYLNSAYFGEGAFGIEEAAQTYFGKDAKDLDLAESTLLSGLLPAPSVFDPLIHPQKAYLRQKIILQEMLAQKYINLTALDQAEAEKLKFNDGSSGIANSLAPHFALMVLGELNNKYGEETVARSGFTVKTTLNSDWQRFAQKEVASQVANLAPNNVSNGAAVVIDPKNGEVKVLVGSKDWFDSKFGKVNIAISNRQPGSSFKPIVYSLALQRRLITPATILQDSPTTFNQCIGDINPNASGCVYQPKDYDGKFRGPVTVRRALSNSLNVPAVEVIQKVGVEGALSQAANLGITTLGNDKTKYGLSLVLGAGEVKLLELTNVYATLANAGSINTPTTIYSISDKYGKNIYTYQPTPQQVIDEGVAFQISSILSDNFARAEEFGNTLTISRPAAVKTGTTENYKDAWTLGYTPSLAIGVWVGNNDGATMDQIAGSLGAAPIWKNLMEKYLSGTPIEAFNKPNDVVLAAACGLSIYPENNSSRNVAAASSVGEYFLVGTQSRGCNSIASSSAQLISPQPTIPGSGPINVIADGQAIDCIGPDNKHLAISLQNCRNFNRAWGKE